MPTYDWRCRGCGKIKSVVQGIGSYCEKPIVPECGNSNVDHDTTMERILTRSGGRDWLSGDDLYVNQQTMDGVDISTRTKHRQYMKERGVTTVDDFKDTWAKAAKEREALRTGTFNDPHLRHTVAKEVYKHVNS
jgi:predicted nucleic acid-binding Zn ribbon protein